MEKYILERSIAMGEAIQVVNQDGSIREVKRKICKYKGVEYLVEKENKKSYRYVLDEHGHRIKGADGKPLMEGYFKKYIVVDKEKLYLNSDGNVSTKQFGVSSEVFFLTPEEVELIKNNLLKRVNEANTPTNELIARRNCMLFFCGINVGLRASDLRTLKWKDIYNNDGTMKTSWWFISKKTKKPTEILFNRTFLGTIAKYKEFIMGLKLNGKEPHKEDYLFYSKKNDREPISESEMWRIIKTTAVDVGVKKNIGSHSLRKTFGRTVYENAIDKEDALVMLSEWFEHDSTSTTRRYIGITREQKAAVAHSIDGIFGDMW